VIKIPRWTFEKFPDADETLTTQMKSVGEAMAIGRTFKEALQKGIRSMEVKRFGFGLDKNDKWLKAQDTSSSGTGLRHVIDSKEKHVPEAHATAEWPIAENTLRRKLAVPSQGRLYYVRYALKMGWTIEQIHELTKYDPWFIGQMKELVEFEDRLIGDQVLRKVLTDPHKAIAEETKESLLAAARLRFEAKQLGYSDVQLANAFGVSVSAVSGDRDEYYPPVYKLVDTCAAEFEAATPYYYSSYEQAFLTEKHRGGQDISSVRAEDEIRLTDKPKVIIIGGGPNRIGQGIEFDYCCVHAAFAMKELGYESVMINSNPETVSTDYDTSDLLFFEPLTHEDILNICERLNGQPFAPNAQGKPSLGLVKGVIVQLGGQTPLNLARGLTEAGVPILGTSIDSLDRAGDREQFRDMLQKLGLKQPANGIARNLADAKRIANEVGYPVLVRPSFVLGGRAMEIVSDESQLDIYMQNALGASTLTDTPILIDKFLDNADECDLDCIADYDANGNGRAVVIGVMEHIEEAGIHSGDSACVLPPYTFSKELIARLKEQTYKLAKELRVNGLMNVQYAVKDGEIYVIEVNPRASRTVPFVGKATGMPWAKIAAKVMAGKTLDELGIYEQPDPKHVSVKEVVFPFSKFPGVDVILGPEMRSTGEVMGLDVNFPLAFAKSQLAAGTNLPLKGNAFISVRASDQPAVVPIAKRLAELGFTLFASTGTGGTLTKAGVKNTVLPKLNEGRPNIIDKMKNGEIQLIINTPTKKGPATDEGKIRAASVMSRVPLFTTLTAASALAEAIAALQKTGWGVRPLQSYHPQKAK
jgi:carbamoyl-phosphate synthase large subunit